MDEKMNIAYVIDQLIREVRKQKEDAPDGETARRLAIIVTELEKVYAFALTFLRS